MKTLLIIPLFAVSCLTGPDITTMEATVDQVVRYPQLDGSEQVGSFLLFDDGHRKIYPHYWGRVGTNVECELVDGQYPDDWDKCS